MNTYMSPHTDTDTDQTQTKTQTHTTTHTQPHTHKKRPDLLACLALQQQPRRRFCPPPVPNNIK